MFYETFLRYKNHYSKGIKKIRYKSHFYNLDQQKEDIKIKEMAGNFDLFFNEEGQLTESITYRKKNLHAKFYYEETMEDSRLYLIEETLMGKDYADTVSEFCYDFKDRISLQKISLIAEKIEIQITTVYFENKVIEFYDNINDENYSGYEVFTYDKDQLIKHTIYSKEREKLKTYYFTNDKENNKILEYNDKNYSREDLYDSNGYLKESIFGELGKKTYRKFEYVFNENNDWITQMVTDDGEPRYVIDREITYY